MELEPGEVKCDKCDGTGEAGNNKIGDNQRYFIVPNHCDKCHGTGKLDWIENIVGKRSRTLNVDWTIEWSINEQLYESNLEKNIVDQISKNIAKEIDKDILEGITNGAKSGTWGSSM